MHTHTLSFSLNPGDAIHVAGRECEPIDAELSFQFQPGQKSPFVIRADNGLNEFFEWQFSRLQAARVMTFLRRSLTDAARKNASTDESEPPSYNET